MTCDWHLLQQGEFLITREMAQALVDYHKQMGVTLEEAARSLIKAFEGYSLKPKEEFHWPMGFAD